LKPKVSYDHPFTALRGFCQAAAVWLLALFVFGCLPGSAIAAVDLHKGIEFLEDPRGVLTLEDIQKLPESAFQRNGASAPNFTFTSSVFWFRFKLPASLLQENSLVLSIDYPHLDQVTLYVPDDHGHYVKKRNGRDFPFSSRELKVRSLAFLIEPGRTNLNQFHYIQSSSTSSLQFPMHLMSFREFFAKDHRETIAARLYLGAMLIMFFYNFIFFVTTRDLVYGIYLGFIVSASTLVMAIGGLGFELFWPDSVQFNKIVIPGLIGLNIVITVIFTSMSLPKLREYPRCRALFWSLIPVGLFAMIGALVFRYEVAIKVSIISVLLGASYLIWMLAYLSWKRYRPAYFFSLSFTALMGGTILFAAKTFGLTGQHVLIENGPLLGSAIQVALLTLALADQFREIKRAKEAIQTQMIKLQEQSIRTLDQKVEARTREIRRILDTIRQGIFTFSGQPPRIDAEFSQQMHQLYPGRTLVGEDPIDLLLGQSDLGGDRIAQVRSALGFTLGESLLNFDMNIETFPNFVRTERAGKIACHEIDWSPITNNEGVVEKMLVAVRDVTALKSLEALNRQNREELDLIQQIIAVPQHKFKRFLQGVRELLQQITWLLDEAESHEPKALQRLNAFLHTLKGNARTFGFTGIAQGAHELEDEIKQRTDDRNHRVSLRKKLQEIESHVETMTRISEDKLGRGSNEGTIPCAPADIERILDLLQDLKTFSLPAAASRTLDSIQFELTNLGRESLAGLLEDIIQASRRMAVHTGKLPPDILLEDVYGLRLAEGSFESLTSIFTHLLTNSVDHGLETPDERQAAGKDPRGAIRIQVLIEAERVRMTVGDDGRGLDLKTVHQKAVTQNLLPRAEANPQTIAMTIFSSGFSTAKVVTLLSGRGVGLDVVKRTVEDMGGSILIQFNGEVTAESSRAPFVFVVDLPLSCFASPVTNLEWERVS
jgi:HPt (histidine-containing phosphotransfer) domain-containing protein